ncbi:MAG TPA: VWA domain-containing protein [Terriglobales bacterium]|nr:VWA domain-containing protein [Terriglobales bacterium]
MRMTIGKVSSYALIAALACSIFLFAKPKDKDNSEVKFTARTELVLIPTLVTDKSGNHISGLKKEDFTVLENGAEQKIATFEEITSDPHRSSHPRNPNEFSNSLTGGPSTRRITLIVLDLINTPFVDQAFARKDLLKYLTQSLDQREPTALYTLTRSGIHAVHDFTTDPRVLVAALHKVKGDTSQMVDSPEDVESLTGTASPDGSAGVDPGAVQTEAQQLQTMMEDAELNFQSFQQRLAITYTLEGMQQVAQALGGFPGRKSLIWAGGGFPFSVSDNTMQLAPAGRDSLTDVLPLYEHTWQLLNDAQIALYPVDVKGLQTVTMPSASVRNPGKNYGRNMTTRNLDTQGTFETFASMTGGRAYYNSNDLVKGFRAAVNDSAQYYMLGYYLDRSKTKAGWRKLAVKVKRDHTEVRARSGFFVTNTTIDPGNSRNSDISSALQSPLDYTSLALLVRWDNVEPAKEPGKKRVHYEMHLAPDASLTDDADNNHVVLEFLALAKTPEGKAVDGPMGQKVDAHLTAEKLAAVRQIGLAYGGALDLAPGQYTVRFVVRDDLSGRIGSVAAPLKVE